MKQGLSMRTTVSLHDDVFTAAQLLTHKQHAFWPSSVANLAAVYLRAFGHRQVNDAFLVAVAERRQGRLETLDPKLAAHAGEENLVRFSGRET